MNLKSISYKAFAPSAERNTAKLAAKARVNTIYGGASALRLARHCERLGVKFIDGVSAREVVSDVYSRSTGETSATFEGWECPECGSACLGIELALACCGMESED